MGGNSVRFDGVRTMGLYRWKTSVFWSHYENKLDYLRPIEGGCGQVIVRCNTKMSVDVVVLLP